MNRHWAQHCPPSSRVSSRLVVAKSALKLDSETFSSKKPCFQNLESSCSLRAYAMTSELLILLTFSIDELRFLQLTSFGLPIFPEFSDKRGGSYRGPYILIRELLKSLPRHLPFIPRENHGSKTVGEVVFR